MSRVLVSRSCGSTITYATVPTLLLIGPVVFGQIHSRLPSPDRSDLQVSYSIDIRASNQGSTGSKMVTFQELQHVVPRKARKEMEKAETARLRNHQDDAVRHYQQAISLDPELVAARNNLAVVYLTTARGEPAITQLEAAIKIDPKNVRLFTNLALGYAMIHNYDAEERAARMAAGLNREDALPRLVLGLALVAQQKFTDEALQCFEQASEQYTAAHLFAAKLLMAGGQLIRAKSEIEIYLSRADDPRNRALASRWLARIDQGEDDRLTSLSLSTSRNQTLPPGFRLAEDTSQSLNHERSELPQSGLLK